MSAASVYGNQASLPASASFQAGRRPNKGYAVREQYLSDEESGLVSGTARTDDDVILDSAQQWQHCCLLLHCAGMSQTTRCQPDVESISPVDSWSLAAAHAS